MPLVHVFKHSIPLVAAALLMAGCQDNDDDDRRNDRDRAERTDRPAQDSTVRSDGRTDTWSSPEVRILSILHAKNQEEIELGRLARMHASADSVRQYGEQMVRAHNTNDERVRQVARSINARLVAPQRTHELLKREQGNPSKPSTADTVAQLRRTAGSEFDRQYMQIMRDGHRELTQLVEEAQSSVSNSDVRSLLDETLPTIRHHAQMADNNSSMMR